ncbi:protein-tyrosine kinase 6-like [Cyprinus carpio]|uniref:Tyrosine-protein kinase n=1 Tax=Cyprinus carpio TaxID=7962 RepID=A0A9Q9UYD5_CYPCA|nr:protein-tyrosine kinase 6-like [Cyprinus carpio]
MGECLRKTCPCLKTLWDRIYGSSTTDGENSVKADGDSTGAGLGNTKSDPYGQPAKAPQPPRKTAALHMALWDFEARDGRELSFKAGDMLEIVTSSGDWWSARKIDSYGSVATGFVPFNYLARAESVESQPWFFGKMSRVEALSHLKSAENDNGSFLVRISETSDIMGFVLSVKSQAKAKHFKIYHTSGQFYVDPSPQFASILEVVEYYQTHPLSTSDLLRQPCIRKRPQLQDLSPSTVDEWELPKDQFTLEKMLGGGHFADVYSGKWKNQTKVAIKILKNNDAVVQKDFQLEVQIMKRLRHRHLISLFAVCTSSAPFYIITELIEKGDLLNFLKNPEGSALDMESLIDMAAQVADGMAYLETHNSIHRDLAARNVLVGEGYVCKIADFGLARIIKEPVYISDDKKIPYKWTAPEAIGQGRYSSKSDVWSFGILLYEIVTYGAIPYPGVRNCDVYDLVTRENFRMPSPSNCPEVIYNIMRSCWRAEPEDRPTFKILRHELDKYQGN